VIQRPQLQHDVEAVVLEVQPSGVTPMDLEGHGGLLSGCVSLLDVTGHGIDQRHVVAITGQGRRVTPRPAADIEHPSGRRWEHPRQDL
jgi:hypothetical protein